VEEALDRDGLRLRAILVTHHHPDHVGGVCDLVTRHGAPVLGPAREEIPCASRRLSGGEQVNLEELDLEFSVLDIPGHTLGHIAFHGHGAVFCGDTLFSAGCGRLFEGTPAQMSASLDRLAQLPEATRLYCGHEYTVANLRFAQAVEPANRDVEVSLEASRELRSRDEPTLPSTIGLERRINPFLRCREPAVKAAAAARAGRALSSVEEVFAVIRSWKDGFR
jgi:hydroxyacylglutathione hydrolase